KELLIKYKTHILNKKYYVDFLIDNKIILELKATDNICSEHISQILNYLKASEVKVGYILNFGRNKLEFKRIVL
nr:GxxExxY protein [Candidatus Dependentiae bacterium]